MRKGKVSGLNPTGREARDFTRKEFFSIFRSRFCIFCKNISTGGSKLPSVELAHFYWPPAQTVLKNVSSPFLLASSGDGAEKRQYK